MEEFKDVLKRKRDYYGNTEAAIEFAAEEYANQKPNISYALVSVKPLFNDFVTLQSDNIPSPMDKNLKRVSFTVLAPHGKGAEWVKSIFSIDPIVVDDEEKEPEIERNDIVGYKLSGVASRPTVDAVLGQSMPHYGDILLSGKSKDVPNMTDEEKSVYFTRGHVGGSLVQRCKELKILDIWFVPVFEDDCKKS